MPAWRREAEALITDLCGPARVPWLEWDAASSGPDVARSSVVVSAVGHAAPAADRTRVLAALAARLPPDGFVIVVDHNRPRRRSEALRALVGAPWAPGWSPVARWRRLAHPTARAVQAAGLRVECLRLVAGERVQVVVARRAPR